MDLAIPLRHNLYWQNEQPLEDIMFIGRLSNLFKTKILSTYLATHSRHNVSWQNKQPLQDKNIINGFSKPLQYKNIIDEFSNTFKIKQKTTKLAIACDQNENKTLNCLFICFPKLD